MDMRIQLLLLYVDFQVMDASISRYFASGFTNAEIQLLLSCNEGITIRYVLNNESTSPEVKRVTLMLRKSGKQYGV